MIIDPLSQDVVGEVGDSLLDVDINDGGREGWVDSIGGM